MHTPYTALKLVYNRSTRTYALDCIRDASLLMIHKGYFVYETAHPDQALEMIQSGRCLSGWKDTARTAIIGFLGLEPVGIHDDATAREMKGMEQRVNRMGSDFLDHDQSMNG